MALEPRYLLAPPLPLPVAAGFLVVEPCHGGHCVNPRDEDFRGWPGWQVARTPWTEPAPPPAPRGPDAS